MTQTIKGGGPLIAGLSFLGVCIQAGVGNPTAIVVCGAVMVIASQIKGTLLALKEYE